jgi:hypothetical protein
MKQTKGTGGEVAAEKVLHRVECRAWERHPCDLRGACQPIAANRGHDLSWPAKIRNLSLGGVGLVLERRFEPGVILFLELTFPGSDSPETLMARVVYARAIAGNQWFLGCAFCRPLSPGKIESLVGSSRSPANGEAGRIGPTFSGLTAHGTVEGESSLFPLKSARDKSPVNPRPANRSSPELARQEANRGGLFRKIRNSLLILEGITLEGKVQEETGNLQLARFHLWATWPLPGGTRLLLRIVDPDGNPVAVRIRVASCFQDGELWTIHYEFVETPSAEALSLLGFSAGPTG